MATSIVTPSRDVSTMMHLEVDTSDRIADMIMEEKDEKKEEKDGVGGYDFSSTIKSQVAPVSNNNNNDDQNNRSKTSVDDDDDVGLCLSSPSVSSASSPSLSPSQYQQAPVPSSAAPASSKPQKLPAPPLWTKDDDNSTDDFDDSPPKRMECDVLPGVVNVNEQPLQDVKATRSDNTNTSTPTTAANETPLSETRQKSDVENLQERVKDLETKLATLSLLLNTGKFLNNSASGGRDLNSRFLISPQHEATKSTREHYYQSSSPDSPPPPPPGPPPPDDDSNASSSSSYMYVSSSSGNVDSNKDSGDTRHDEDDTDRQLSTIESPPPPPPKLGEKSAIPYLESPAPWDSCVDRISSHQQSSSQKRKLPGRKVMLDTQANELHQYESHEQETVVVAQQQQNPLASDAMLPRKRLSYLLLHDAHDEQLVIDDHAQNINNADCETLKQEQVVSLHPESPRSVAVTTNEASAVVTATDANVTSTPSSLSKGSGEVRSPNQKTLVSPKVTPPRPRSDSIATQNSMDNVTQQHRASYNSLLFAAIKGSFNYIGAHDDYHNNSKNKNDCKVRNKWLDHLNSYQDTNHDVDIQMQEFIKVPGCVESLLGFGLLICVDSFLYVCTILPIRFVWSCLLLILGTLENTIYKVYKRIVGNSKGTQNEKLSGKVRHASYVGFGNKYGSDLPHAVQFHRRHLYQLIQVGILYFVYSYVLCSISIGKLYHWIRGQSMIKLYVVIAMVEVFDRLMSSLGQDCLDSMYWNTTRRPRSTRLYISIIVVVTYTTIHSLLLFVHVATLNVAMNSADQALLGLLIGGNFAEIKSTVFKKYNKPNLFKITTGDICERFKLALFLGLILLLNLSQGMDTKMMYEYTYMCGIVWCAELISDWLKHAFITKFNFISSQVYSEYALLLAGDVTGIGHEGVNLDHSHAVVKRIAFAQFPLVCVMMRMLREATKYYFNYDHPEEETQHLHKYTFGFTLFTTSVLLWICLCFIKMFLGNYLKKNCLSKLHSALASTTSPTPSSSNSSSITPPKAKQPAEAKNKTNKKHQ